MAPEADCSVATRRFLRELLAEFFPYTAHFCLDETFYCSTPTPAAAFTRTVSNIASFKSALTLEIPVNQMLQMMSWERRENLATSELVYISKRLRIWPHSSACGRWVRLFSFVSNEMVNSVTRNKDLHTHENRADTEIEIVRLEMYHWHDELAYKNQSALAARSSPIRTVRPLGKMADFRSFCNIASWDIIGFDFSRGSAEKETTSFEY